MTDDASTAPNRPRRIAVVSPFNETDWRWLAKYFPEDAYTWDFHNGALYGRNQLHWARYCLRVARGLRGVDAVLSFHPYVTLWMGFWLRVLGKGIPHAAFGFNHGNKRFFKGWSRAVSRVALPTVDYFVVSSMGERGLFRERYGIPMEKLIFHHFAVNPPAVDTPLPEDIAAMQPYAICIGRNNRDLACLARAAEGAPLRIIAVTGPGGAAGLAAPETMTVLEELPLRRCMNLLHGAAFHIVPIIDNETGAGHMTVVAAMHLGKAQIVTEVENVKDYFIGGAHGLWAARGDAASLRAAIDRLHNDDGFREECAARARTFAQDWLSEEAAARNARDFLARWLSGAPIPPTPDGWEVFLAGIES